jgi:hypothetical protein
MSDLDILIDEYVDSLFEADLNCSDDLDYKRVVRNLLGHFANRLLTEGRYAR